MRKRIVIGIIAMGVLAFVLSEWRKWSVEYHRRECLSAWERIHHGTWWSRLKERHKVLRKIRATGDVYVDVDWERCLAHRAALVELGYVVQRRFILTNRPTIVRHAFSRHFGREPGFPLFFQVRGKGGPTNEVVFTVPRTFVPRLEEWLAKADVPEVEK